jgi:hypothetical protein
MTPPYFFLEENGTLALTIEPDDLCVCAECPNLHIRVLAAATPTDLRQFAKALTTLADLIEVKS